MGLFPVSWTQIFFFVLRLCEVGQFTLHSQCQSSMHFHSAITLWVHSYKATLNFQKFKAALNPTNRILNFAKNCTLSCLSNVNDIKKFHHAVFELQFPKAVIKGVFSRSYCCYGNLLSFRNDNQWLGSI